MAGKSIRDFTVVQDVNEILDTIDQANRLNDYTELTLQDPESGMEMSVRFRVNQREHPEEGTHRFICVTDLDRDLNIIIDAKGRTTARLM